MQKVLVAYVKLKKVLTGSSPKGKTQTFDSTGIESDDQAKTSVKRNDIMIIIIRGKRRAW